MTTDEELLAEVRAMLADEVADVSAGPGMLAGVRRAHGRRWLRRRLTVALPVMVAVGVVAVVVLAPSQSQSPSSRAPAEPANAAYVREKTTHALDSVLDNVVHEQSWVTEGEKYSKPGENALYERWIAADGRAFRFRVTIDGQPVVDLSQDAVADVFVDYRDHTYTASPGTEMSAPEYDDVWTPTELRQGLTDGIIRVLGPGEPIDGKPTIKLYREPRKADVPMDLWVDATTYLPVRWQLRQDNSTPFDVTWLPPTPENLAQLTTDIPPGFTRQ